MVLERLFPEDWLEKKFQYAFILGFAYSALGIAIAELLFPANSGIVSVIFTSVFLSPSLRKIFFAEEKSEEKVMKASWKNLYRLHYDTVLMYFLVFFGIFFAYLAFSFLLPQLGLDAFNIVKEQLFLDPNLRGRAVFSIDSLISILYNNWWVLVATFFLALIAGDGAIFFVAWNASAWGAIFGARALVAASYSGASPWAVLLSLLSVVILHVILEGGAYILVGIAGSIISNEIVKEKIEVKEFVAWFSALGLGIFGLRLFLNLLQTGLLVKFISYFLSLIGSLYFLKKIVAEKKNAQVFTFSIKLFILGILIFLAGAVAEVYVVGNSPTLERINTLFGCYTSGIPAETCIV